MELMKEFRFEASHILPKHPGKCSRLHGHSWVLKVFVKGKINPDTGFVMDFGVIKQLVQPLVDSLDHHHLGVWTFRGMPWVDNASLENSNDNPGLLGINRTLWGVHDLPEDFYPTSENLLMWIADKLSGTWSKLELNETCTSAAILTREEYDGLST